MNRSLIATFALLLAGIATAACAADPVPPAPPCWPKQLGSTGSDFKQGETADGRWIGWTCLVKGKPTVFGVVAVADYRIQHPDVAGMTPTKAAAAYWKANATSAQDERLTRLRAELHGAFK